MDLFYRTMGEEGEPILILHGVFGSSDNWHSMGKELASNGYSVYMIDARNHGQSPHSEAFGYATMADDLHQFIEKHQLQNPIIIGHSMGGKTLMEYLMRYDNFSKAIVVDIAPRYYAPHHQHIIKGLHAVVLDVLNSRSEAEEILAADIPSQEERQFLLKNLYRKGDGKFAWRMNLPILSLAVLQIGNELKALRTIEKPTLFLRGEKSAYIRQEDESLILQIFPNAQIHTISNAGHWIQAEQPKLFLEAVLGFLEEQ